MAYKRELIINNGSLTSYKKILKVSDVCQLLDKSKYSATKTVNGVTYTNNGDGIVTLSGTATGQSSYVLIQDIGMAGHRYLVFGCPVGGSYNTYRLTASIYKNGSWVDGFSDDGNGNISKVLEEGESIGISIDVKNKPDANLVFKPQLFDLTEMYGAGNEPATVAEFKAKFPNELYDYSPRCWVTSYKTGLIAKTKNLFDYKTPEYANATLIETLSNGAILKGNLSDDSGTGQYPNGWFRPGQAKNKRIELKTGDIVTISADYTLLEQYSSESNICNIHLYCDIDSLSLATGASTVKLPLNKTVRISQTYTIKGDTDYYPVFTLNSNKVKITNIQIAKGTTATDYVPYGYL